MPNRKQNNPEPNLDEQIEELVADMAEATEKLAEEIAQAEQADEAFETDALLDSAVQAKSAPEPESAEAANEEAAPSLDAQVDEMLEDAAASAAQAPAPKSTVDAVDEELAELADEMLDGDFDDADAVLSAGIEAPRKPTSEPKSKPPAAEPESAITEDAPADETDDLLEGDFDDAEEVIAQGEPEPPKPSPKPTVKVESAPPEVPAAAENESVEQKSEPVVIDDDDAESESEPDEPKKVRHAKPKRARTGRIRQNADDQHRWRVIAEETITRTGEVAHSVAEKINKPLDTQPAGVKDIAGWLAAVTLFNAAAVWVFLLIGRGPAPGTSAEPTIDLVGQQTSVNAESDAID